MPSPTVTFGFIIATLFGAGFHLIFGGGARRLALFLLMGWLSFAIGHIIGVVFVIDLFNIGVIRMMSASITTIIILLLTHALTKKRPKKQSTTHSR